MYFNNVLFQMTNSIIPKIYSADNFLSPFSVGILLYFPAVSLQLFVYLVRHKYKIDAI